MKAKGNFSLGKCQSIIAATLLRQEKFPGTRSIKKIAKVEALLY